MTDINKEFGINDFTTMHYGGSIFDLKYFDIDISMINYVYNSLASINSGHMPEVFTGTLWMTGNVNREFEWRNRSNIFKRCYECLGKDGFIHTSEFINNPEAIWFILSHMRWYQNKRIVKSLDYINLQLYEVGVLEKTWSVDPISIKYYTKMPSKDDTPDYLYLLGGSPELFSNFDRTNQDHLTAYYGFYRYLLIAKEKLGLRTIYEKNGSVETALCIDHVINDIKGCINEIL